MELRAQFALCALLLLSPPLACSRHDDDFAFDNSDEFQVDLTANHSEIAKNGLRRLWGVPDTSAYVGHLFRMEIPKEAFSGDVLAYKVRGPGGRRAPAWLAIDTRHGLVSGVPLVQDVGAHVLTVTAHGRTPGLTASDSFTIEVKNSNEKAHSRYGVCGVNESKLVLTVLVDAHMNQIKPRQRIRALMELAKFMALDGGEFSIEPYKLQMDPATFTVVSSGPGNSNRRSTEGATAIYLNVGCGGKLWSRHKVLVAGVREQARDGTLSHVLRLPVLGWRLVAVKNAPEVPRHKRQSHGEGSGGAYGDDYDAENDDGDYSGYDEDDDVDYDSVGPPIEPSTDSDQGHKEVQIVPFSVTNRENSGLASSVNPRRFEDFSVMIIPDPPTTFSTETPSTIAIQPNEPSIIAVSVPASTSSTTSTTAAPASTLVVTTSTTIASTTPETTTPVAETTLIEVTQQESSPATEKSSTITGQTTETIEFILPTAPSNQPPVLRHHMKKLPVIAGKAFRYIIPVDFFTDPEDGTNLRFSMLEADNAELKPTSWVQFYPVNREVYGLPLEEHVSRWHYIIEAKDQEGESARGPLDITVQQHKGRRTVNHEFTIQLKLNRKYTIPIEWQIRVLEGLVNLFRDTDMENLTVRSISQKGDLFEFTWTNDTLPKEKCPTEDIARLMKILELDGEKGSPSAALTKVMSPELKISSVWWSGVGPCAPTPTPPAAPPTNNMFPPVPRNQVDQVQAMANHLLVFKVPEDTFYDPEDGGTRNLRLSLKRDDLSPLPTSHWMQFDAKNQEFYGLPTDRDIGRKHYQLIAEDSTGRSSSDMLVVEVNPAPNIRPPVEFQMTLEYSYGSLAEALPKRKLVEKLAQLFGDKDTESIRVKSITDHPTTIAWVNTSLPMDICPHDKIKALKEIIIHGDQQGAPEMLTEHVDGIFDKEFKVMSIRLIPQNLCAEQRTEIQNINVHEKSSVEHESKSVSSDDYLITFVIPVVVVVCMVLIAGVIACVLYRRRRTGKMSVGDEEERQAFRSKGIPVIFQDELEDKPEPSHKSPVIMQEEKPPLLPPPDYRGGESPPASHSPYRPPPPFTASRDAPRPKPTPSYRKPPPYVPP